jgi:hypothetical protein
VWKLKKLDHLALLFLLLALILYVIILFLPWTIITLSNGEIDYKIGFQEAGLWPIISTILIILIYQLSRQNIHIMKNDYVIPIIIIYTFLLILSFNTIYFHMEYYLSNPILSDLVEYSHGIGYYIGLVAVVLQLIGAIITLKIIRDKIKIKK